MSGAADVKSGVAGAETLGAEGVDVIGEYLLPILGGFGGFMAGTGLGGAGLIWSIGNTAAPQTFNGNAWGMASRILAGGLWATVGFAVGSAEHSAGKWGGYIIKTAKWFLLGTAARFAFAGVTNASLPAGLLDSAATTVQNLAAGATQ